MNLIDQAPENWIRAKVRDYCDVQLGKMLQNDPSSEEDELKPYLRAINIGKSGLDLSHEFSMWIRPREVDRFRLVTGDILVSEGGDAGRTAVFDADGDYYFQNAINRVRPNLHSQIEPQFIYYWFTFLKAAGYVKMICNAATIPHFTFEKVKAAPLALPSLDMQCRIARFLDEKTARVDALIEKKRELLNRLTEKRQALITNAVTKGLNSNAPMKPSGINWLGDIPTRWQVLRLKFIVSEPLSYGANAAAEFDKPEWPRFVRITDVDEFGRLRDETFRSLPPEVAQEFLLRPNDILLARSGATVGKSLIYKVSWGVACYAGYMIRVRINKKHDARYFYWFLNSASYWEWIKSTFIQSTIQNISAERYANLYIPHPSDSYEQKEIVDFLEDSCAELDRQFEQIMLSLECLVEYRSALITAAVTGQLKELR